MLYQLTASTGHTRVVDAPAHRRGRWPIAVEVWARDVWLPSIAGAHSCEVAAYQPLKFNTGGPVSCGVSTVLGTVQAAWRAER